MRDAAAFIEEAVRSVLAETQVPIELIIVDDGSTDGSRAIVESIGDRRVHLLDGPQEGIAAAFNLALDESRGDVVMRCDADDAYPAGRIAEQLHWLDARPDFVAVCGAFMAMDPDGRTRFSLGMAEQASEITGELTSGTVRTHFCTFAVRTEVLKGLGGARSFFTTGEDVDLQLRIGEQGRVWYSPQAAYVYRLHASSITHTIKTDLRDYFEAQARAFQKQRKLSGADDLQLGKAPQPPRNLGSHTGSADAHLQSLLVARTWHAFQEGDRAGTIRFGLMAVKARPLSPLGWRTLLVSLGKTALVSARSLASSIRAPDR